MVAVLSALTVSSAAFAEMGRAPKEDLSGAMCESLTSSALKKGAAETASVSTGHQDQAVSGATNAL